MGDYVLCRKYFLVCNGGIVNWVSKSIYLGLIFEIFYFLENEDLFCVCILKRLFLVVLDKIIKNSNF